MPQYVPHGTIHGGYDGDDTEVGGGSNDETAKDGDGAKPHRVPLPLEGSFRLRQTGGVWAAHADLDGVLIPFESWTHAPRLLLVTGDGQARDTGLQPAGRFDHPSDIATTEVTRPESRQPSPTPGGT